MNLALEIIIRLLIDAVAIRLPGLRETKDGDTYTVARYWLLGNVVFVLVTERNGMHPVEVTDFYAVNVETAGLYADRDVYEKTPMDLAAMRELISLQAKNVNAAEFVRETLGQEFPEYLEQMSAWQDRTA